MCLNIPCNTPFKNSCSGLGSFGRFAVVAAVLIVVVVVVVVIVAVAEVVVIFVTIGGSLLTVEVAIFLETSGSFSVECEV